MTSQNNATFEKQNVMEQRDVVGDRREKTEIREDDLTTEVM